MYIFTAIKKWLVIPSHSFTFGSSLFTIKRRGVCANKYICVAGVRVPALRALCKGASSPHIWVNCKVVELVRDRFLGQTVALGSI